MIRETVHITEDQPIPGAVWFTVHVIAMLESEISLEIAEVLPYIAFVKASWSGDAALAGSGAVANHALARLEVGGVQVIGEVRVLSVMEGRLTDLHVEPDTVEIDIVPDDLVPSGPKIIPRHARDFLRALAGRPALSRKRKRRPRIVEKVLRPRKPRKRKPKKAKIKRVRLPPPPPPEPLPQLERVKGYDQLRHFFDPGRKSARRRRRRDLGSPSGSGCPANPGEPGSGEEA